MLKISKQHNHNLKTFKTLLENLNTLLLPEDVICLDNKEKKYVLMHADLFEELKMILQTVEDPYTMMEFHSFMKDKNKAHPFTDILKGFYASQGCLNNE